jgi:hypothetical protein
MARSIKSVDPRKFEVLLTTTSRDINDEQRWEREYCGNADEYYHVRDEKEARQDAAELKRRQSKKVLGLL